MCWPWYINRFNAGSEDQSAFLAYSHAKNSEKNPEEKEKYGRPYWWSCSSETANNAVTGGAMVPLLSLGFLEIQQQQLF